MSDIQISFKDSMVGGKPAKVILFVGQLDETNVDHEAKKIYHVITEMNEPILILDFSSLEYMNSKSIGYLTDWFTQASNKNGSVSIISPKPNILDILKVVGITQIIQIYDSMDSAMTAMGGSPSGTMSQGPVPTPTPSPTPEAPSATPLDMSASETNPTQSTPDQTWT